MSVTLSGDGTGTVKAASPPLGPDHKQSRIIVASGVTALGATSMLSYIFAVPEAHPHLEGDRHDLIAYGLELVAVGVCIYVGCKLVAEKTFRL
jgi:hypothetical protein